MMPSTTPFLSTSRSRIRAMKGTTKAVWCILPSAISSVIAVVHGYLSAEDGRPSRHVAPHIVDRPMDDLPFEGAPHWSHGLFQHVAVTTSRRTVAVCTSSYNDVSGIGWK